MSRKLFAFFLSELSMVRVVCKQCGGIVEVAANKLPGCFKNPHCHFCPTDFASGGHENIFEDLSKLIGTVKVLSKSMVDIEFILPDNGDDE